MRKTLTFLVLLLLPVQANAYYWDGNDLLKMCKLDRSLAQGYIVGNVDFDGMLSVAETISKDAKPSGSACIPPTVTPDQMTDVLCKYLNDNPATRHQVGAVIIGRVVHESWPCK